MNRNLFIVLLFASALIIGCGGQPAHNTGKANDTDNSNTSTGNGGETSEDDHGAPREVGKATIAGVPIVVNQAGHVRLNTESAFDLKVDGNPTAVRGWIGTEDHTTSLSGIAKADKEEQSWHLHLPPMTDLPIDAALWVEVENGGETGKASFPIVYAGPHDGILATFSGVTSGVIELKLHDDKGDLEFWIASDAAITKPIDLPLAATITVEFTDKDKRVTLMVRNKDKNEDEDGTANVRDGKTNYFIFPGDTGADATWLQGHEFEATVKVTFNAGGECMTGTFTLVPHQHMGEGHEH